MNSEKLYCKYFGLKKKEWFHLKGEKCEEYRMVYAKNQNILKFCNALASNINNLKPSENCIGYYNDEPFRNEMDSKIEVLNVDKYQWLSLSSQEMETDYQKCLKEKI